MTTRRGFLIGSAAWASGCANPETHDAVAQIEKTLGGRVGLSALDTGSGHRIRWRADERFAMCSTFKVALAAEVLARIDRRGLLPNRILTFDPANLLGSSRVSAQHLDGRYRP